MKTDSKQPETVTEAPAQVPLAAPTGSEAWQPIATAPKDETRLLLWCDGEIEIGHFSMSGWVTKPDGNGGWIGAWIIYENRSDTIELNPTHWQRLPSPPNIRS